MSPKSSSSSRIACAAASAVALFCADTALASDPWTNLGGGDFGSAGVPLLVGDGVLESLQNVSIDLTSAASGSLAFLFVSTSSTPTLYSGGVLHAFPIAVSLALFTDNAGKISLPVTVPAGFPTGIPVYTQYAIADGAASGGVALSNGLRALTPSVAPAITTISPLNATVGTHVLVHGDFFGDVTNNLCTLAINGNGDVVATARVASAADTLLGIDVIDIVPGTTTGKLAIVRGNGTNEVVTGLGTSVVVGPGPWVFIGNGPPTVSTQTMNLIPPPLPPGPCVTLYSTFNVAKNRYEIVLPFKSTATCAANTQYVLDFHCDFVDNGTGQPQSLHIDYAATTKNTAAALGSACAQDICLAYNFALIAKEIAFYGFFKYAIFCSLETAADGTITMYFPQPLPITFTKVWMWLKVC